MKVLHLRASNFYGGPERQLHLHAREARGSDCDVVVASFTEGGRRPEFLEVIAADGIRTHAFAVGSAYDFRSVGLLRDYLRDHRIDLLCTHEYRSTTVGWLATRRGHARWMAFSRGFTTENLKVRVYHGIDRLLMRRADHVVAVSEAQARKVEKLGIPRERISVVLNAIDPALMEGGEAVDLRARYGFDAGDFVAVAGGRFSQEKGQVHLVEAAGRATREVPRLRVVLFGDGPDRQALIRRIEREGLAAHVLCPGFERDMAGCIRGADLLVNPSLSEGLPNIVLEAMGAGTPVLATAVGGVPEIITDRVSGRLVPAADAGALASALVEAVRDPGTSRAMALRARASAADELGFARQFESMRAAYRRGVGLDA